MKILETIANLIFLKQCFNCKSWGKFICEPCSNTISITKHQVCIECQKPSMLGFTHPKCKTKFSADRLISICNYKNPIVRQAINTAKLAMIPEIFKELSQIAFSNVEMNTITVNNFSICPIPLSTYKQRFRGFNQSQIIAECLSKKCTIPIDGLLSKNVFIKQQKKLDKEARQRNTKNAFQIRYPEALPQHIILIDDVTTTGATFRSATKTLKQAGITTVYCLALAQD